MRLVKENYPDVPVQFNTCIQKGVAEEIDPLLDLAVDLGVRVSFDVITEFRHGKSGPIAETDMGMPLHELQEVCAKLVERKRQGAPVLNSEQYFAYFADGKPGYRCHMPKVVMFVNGQGDVENCLNLENRIANIASMPLAEIMKLPAFRQLRTDAEACCTCNSPTMVDVSKFWENPQSLFEQGGIQVG